MSMTVQDRTGQCMTVHGSAFDVVGQVLAVRDSTCTWGCWPGRAVLCESRLSNNVVLDVLLKTECVCDTATKHIASQRRCFRIQGRSGVDPSEIGCVSAVMCVEGRKEGCL